MKSTTKNISGIATTLALIGGIAACGSSSKLSAKPLTTSAPAPSVQQTCSEAADVTAARIEKAISAALQSTDVGTWDKGGGDVQGAYEQDSYLKQNGPPPFKVSLYTSPKLAAEGSQQELETYWQANYEDGCAVLSVANSATPAEIAAAQANHSPPHSPSAAVQSPTPTQTSQQSSVPATTATTAPTATKPTTTPTTSQSVTTTPIRSPGQAVAAHVAAIKADFDRSRNPNGADPGPMPDSAITATHCDLIGAHGHEQYSCESQVQTPAAFYTAMTVLDARTLVVESFQRRY